MKNSEIKKRLRAEADSHTPDALDSIKSEARAQNLLPPEREAQAVYGGGGVAVKSKAKRNASIAAAAVAVVVCAVLVFVFVFFGGSGVPSAPHSLSFSASDVYGMGAVSTARLLGGDIPSAAVKTFSAVGAAGARNGDGKESAVKAYAQRFNEYFTALDSFLGDDVVKTTTQKNTNEAYAFDTVMTVTGMDMSGKTDTYVMYYTETLVKSEIDDDDDESEIEYRLIGVMVIDGADYAVEGERTEERDKKESESELKIRAYADASDKSTYIEMAQEHSVENKEVETEYVYSVYVNGALVEQTSVEFETERKGEKEKSEYELEFRYGASKGKYKLEREVKNGAAKIKVKYDVDGESGVFEIRDKNDGDKSYEYVFKDGSTLEFR